MTEIHIAWRIFLAVFAVMVFFIGRVEDVKGPPSTMAWAMTQTVLVTLISAALAALAAIGKVPW
jgi:hypothetical protein